GAEIRIRHPSCAARAGHRSLRPHPHVGRDRRDPARAGRHHRHRIARRRLEGRYLPRVGRGRPARQQNRFCHSHHASSDRHRGRMPGRTQPAQEPRACDVAAEGAPARHAACRAGGDAGRHAQAAGRFRRSQPAHPHQQLPAGAGDRPPHQPDPAPTSGNPGRRPRRTGGCAGARGARRGAHPACGARMSSKTASALVARVVERLERGDTAGAEAQARKLRETVPDDAELARLHGVALLMLDRNAEACTALREALAIEPSNIAVQSNLASALMTTGAPEEAVALLQKAVVMQPGDPALHNNLANALRAAGDDERAREAYLAALAIAPDHFSSIVNLAATELSLGRTVDAEARLRGVLAHQLHPQALLLLGHTLNRQQRYAEAQAVYQQAAQLAPNAAQFPYQASLMADEQHHFGEAVQLYHRALQLDPNLHLAEGQLLFVLRRECDWAAAEPLSRRIKARALDGSGSIDPFVFLAEDATAAEQLVCARARAGRVEHDIEPLRRHLKFVHARREHAHPLKVGFVSAGFHAHATALLTVEMFEQLGRRDDVEVHLFATTPDDGSEVRTRLRKAVHAFHDATQQPVTAIAQRVHDAAIDVLIDIDGWCAGGVPGAFALRPAPVQAGWLAYPGTSGAPFIDYLIADRFLIPEPLQRFYSESVAYLPRCYQPSDTTRVVGAPPPRSAFGLPEDATVFASFNNSWKLNAPS